MTDVYVKGNEQLKAGDPLYQIDPTPFQDEVNRIQSDLKRTQSAIDYFQAELARYQKLESKGFSSQEKVDQVKTNLLKQKASKSEYQSQLELAKFNLSKTLVTAPTDGYVTQVALRPGMKSRIVPFQGNLTLCTKKINSCSLPSNKHQHAISKPAIQLRSPSTPLLVMPIKLTWCR